MDDCSFTMNLKKFSRDVLDLMLFALFLRSNK